MITSKLPLITIITTLAILLGSFSVNVHAETDFMNEEDAIDNVPIGGDGGTQARDTQSECNFL